MERLELPRELLTGVKDIDTHHTELYAWADRIVRSEADEQDLKQAIVFLSGYVNYHFAAEESAMITHGFKDYEKHRKQHRAFIRLVHRFRETAMAEGINDNVREMLKKAFRVWFTNHIGLLDRKFAEFLKSKGITHHQVLPNRGELESSGALDEYDQVEIKGPYDGEVTLDELKIRLKAKM
ncbi:MAG: hypothetical protein GXP54_08740 [Deltaproteobacteria bacterium]|nr:hypothetical protein [Deltaproteobacteria bacterium]